MGGALLSTSRWDEFVEARAMERDALLTRMVGHLENVDILYVIGGDGSMRAAHAIWKKANDLGSRRPGKKPLSVVGIPKTMDNDILWVWQSFGFLSAVEKAREAVLNLHTEAKSNPRLCILQLFGSDSGFVANHAGLASGVCDAVLIPEVDYTMEGLFDHLQERLSKRYVESPHALVVMAETAIPLDAREYIASEGNGADDRNLLVELSGARPDAGSPAYRRAEDRVRRASENDQATPGTARLLEELPGVHQRAPPPDPLCTAQQFRRDFR
jgi:6-phosphofructokinase